MSLFNKIVILSLCLFTFLAFYRPLEIEDNWWHLSAGRWMVQHRDVVRSDPFPSFEDVKPWILTQWLGSSLFYEVYAMAGAEGLKIFRLAIFAVVIGIFVWYTRRKIPLVWLAVLIVLIEYGLIGRVLLRPDIFNYLFIQLFLILLFDHHDHGRRKSLAVMCGLGALWSNLHLGSFVYGYALIGLFLAADAVRWFALKFETGAHQDEQDTIKRNFFDLAAVFVLYPLTFVVSPYGFDAVMYPFKVFFVPDFIQIYRFVGVIAEAFPPIYIFTPSGLWVLLLCLFVLGGIAINRKDRLLHTFLLVFPLFLFLRGGRASGFFVLAAAYVIVRCVVQSGVAGRWPAQRYGMTVNGWTAVALIAILAMQVMQGVTERIYIDGRFKAVSAVDLDPRLPLRPIEFLKSNRIEGVVFLNDNLGGFLLWSAYPELKPFVDGRQLHPDLFFKQVSVLKQPHIYWPPVAAAFNLNIVLLDVSMPVYYNLARYLVQAPDWQLIYLKGEHLIFVRRNVFSLNEELATFQERLGHRPVSPDARETLLKMAGMSRATSWNNIVNPSPRYSDLREEASTLIGLGFFAEGIDRLIAAFQQTHDPVIPQMASATLHILAQYPLRQRL